MREWTDPRYTDIVAAYRLARPAGPPKRRRGWAKRPYGDGFVIVVDPATMTPYLTTHGIPNSR